MRWNQNVAARRGGERSTVRALPVLRGHRKAEDGEPRSVREGCGPRDAGRVLPPPLRPPHGPRSRAWGWGEVGEPAGARQLSRAPWARTPNTGLPKEGPVTQAWGEKWGAVGPEPLWVPSSRVSMVGAEPPLTRRSLICPHY